jgi:hypothetical protein
MDYIPSMITWNNVLEFSRMMKMTGRGLYLSPGQERTILPDPVWGEGIIDVSAHWRKNGMIGTEVWVMRLVHYFGAPHDTSERVFTGLYETNEQAENAAMCLQRFINGCWHGDANLPHYYVFSGTELLGIMSVKAAMDRWAKEDDPQPYELFGLSGMPVPRPYGTIDASGLIVYKESTDDQKRIRGEAN